MKGHFRGDTDFLNSWTDVYRLILNVPAVFHQIENNLVQDLLKQRGTDPQVLNSLWGEAGESGHLTKTVLTLQALTSSADGESHRF